MTEIIKLWRDEFDLKISQLEIYYNEVLKIKRKQI
jgi:hypothetical protein